MSTERQSGRTTQQILNAPDNAVYVWCNSRLMYPILLAKHLDREDIYFVSPSWLVPNRAWAVDLPVVTDHACDFGPEQYAVLDMIRGRQNARKT